MLSKEFLEMREDEVYILMAVARKKFNPLSRSTEIVWREVIRKVENYDRKYEKIVSMIKSRPDMKFYLYLSANPRNCTNALYTTTKRLIDYMAQPNERIKKIDAVWMSELMKEYNRSSHTKRWIIDCDTKSIDKVVKLSDDIKKVTNLLYTQETKNGYHFIISPCDIRKINLPDYCELKRDGLVYMDSFNF